MTDQWIRSYESEGTQNSNILKFTNYSKNSIIVKISCKSLNPGFYYEQNFQYILNGNSHRIVFEGNLIKRFIFEIT